MALRATRYTTKAIVAGLLFGIAAHAIALDLDALWDFGNPGLSEARFRAAQKDANRDEELILQTQIARTYGLRGDYDKARALLQEIEPRIASASGEARARYWLELGRSYTSATHSPESQTSETRERARTAYDRAVEAARSEKRDDLQVDALHMLALVDPSPAGGIKWTRQALAMAEASSMESARRWAPSLHHNLGYALYQQGKYAEALDEFNMALRLRESRGSAESIRVARWMVAWTLRALGRNDEALAIQLALEKERDAAGAPSTDVYEELEALYLAKGDVQLAARYAERRKAAAAR